MDGGVDRRDQAVGRDQERTGGYDGGRGGGGCGGGWQEGGTELEVGARGDGVMLCVLCVWAFWVLGGLDLISFFLNEFCFELTKLNQRQFNLNS